VFWCCDCPEAFNSSSLLLGCKRAWPTATSAKFHAQFFPRGFCVHAASVCVLARHVASTAGMSLPPVIQIGNHFSVAERREASETRAPLARTVVTSGRGHALGCLSCKASHCVHTTAVKRFLEPPPPPASRSVPTHSADGSDFDIDSDDDEASADSLRFAGPLAAEASPAPQAAAPAQPRPRPRIPYPVRCAPHFPSLCRWRDGIECKCPAGAVCSQPVACAVCRSDTEFDGPSRQVSACWHCSLSVYSALSSILCAQVTVYDVKERRAFNIRARKCASAACGASVQLTAATEGVFDFSDSIFFSLTLMEGYLSPMVSVPRTLDAIFRDQVSRWRVGGFDSPDMSVTTMNRAFFDFLGALDIDADAACTCPHPQCQDPATVRFVIDGHALGPKAKRLSDLTAQPPLDPTRMKGW
jgi:hypothetical protein